MSDKVPPKTKRPDIVHLAKFPLPPSANLLYATVGRRRVRSHAYKMFESAARKWMILNPEMVDEARQLTLDAGPNRFIHIDTVFRMLRKNIFTKEQKPKRNDSSNRIKALHDVVAEMLGIDDCYFWSGSYDKVAVDDESEVGVDITMVISTYTDQGCDSSPANW